VSVAKLVTSWSAQYVKCSPVITDELKLPIALE
jgi:hypothetical protein